eukprot:TRINITY_DN483_c0_g2_i1.p1 TRINITY_DN483_c0_g2~~TRINITY_DN483_c0_g2_i1.p1  ORF type:complete len:2278 (+),score=1112.95 TRINITY_DN483_c0_g2_i1:484-6834(+)
MAALGDKIASTIIAQTASVPTIAWSGSGLVCEKGAAKVPDELFHRACIRDAQHCVEVCRRLQFPLMIKASEGGGGKGIRMVNSEVEVENAYHAVAGEVQGSPIFVMKLASDVRHLEVQLLADEDGECIALRTRDCSVQRRHQKIIEEGPVVNTIPGVLDNMENAAVRLAKAVGYRSVGTVEYLYHKGTGMFYFLELNPRLQVEHTVTELITGVNLPACMLCVGMGIPISRIPDVRAYYGKDRFTADKIDFESATPNAPKVHTIACRITAENPDDGFTPTTGRIDEITFRNSKNLWGYFSVSSHGGVHEFADSQFGHIFSTADSREEAIAGMVLALKQLTIRGEIRSTKEYLLKLLDMPQFKESDISTAWLDALIKNRLKVEAPNPFLSVMCAATFKATERFDSNKAKYMSFLEAGHVPSSDLFTTRMSFNLVLEGVKYDVICSKSSETEWMLSLAGSHILVGVRRLADRGLLLSLEDGRSPVVYAEEDAACLRVNIDGRTATFTHEVDPTKLRSNMPGKLVRFLVADGDHVEAHQPFCEVEVMKMYLQLKTSIPGVISLKGMPGTTVHAGKILAVIDPDDPDNVVSSEENKKAWPPLSQMAAPTSTPPTTPRISSTTTGGKKAKDAITIATNLLSGYEMPKDAFERALARMAEGMLAVQETGIDVTCLSALTAELSSEDLSKLCVGEEAAKNRFVLCIARLCELFLGVEALYEGGKLHQEVVDNLRSERQGRLSEVFDIQLAHAGPFRYRVLAQLLSLADQGQLVALPELRSVLQRIAALSSARASSVVFSARHLLRKIDLPCPNVRRKELQDSLLKARADPKVLKTLVNQLNYGTDVISSFLMTDDSDHLPVALELLLRRIYAGVFDMTEFNCERLIESRVWVAKWAVCGKENQNPLKHDGITGATSQEDLEAAAHASESGRPGVADGILGIFDSAEEALVHFGDILSRLDNKIDTVCKIIVRESQKQQQTPMLGQLQKIVTEYKRMLQSTKITRVTFLVITDGKAPLYFTFRKSLGFEEDTTYRYIAPSLAHMLELQKLRNYDIELYQGTPVSLSQVHVYVSREKRGMRTKPVPTLPRLFVRTLIVPSDIDSTAPPAADGLSELTMYDAERVVAGCINALEIATADRNVPPTAANHIFIAFEGLKADYSVVETVAQKITGVHASSLQRLGIIEVEIKLFCTLPSSDKAVLMRVFLSNPTTHALTSESYIEVEDSSHSGRSILVHVTKDGSVEEDLSEQLTPSPAGQARDVAVKVGKLDVPTPIGRSNSYQWDDGSADADSQRSPQTLYRLKVRTSASSDTMQHGSKKALYWHHASPLTPYPLLTPHQLRRMSALMNGTVYVYDWISLFEKCLHEQWDDTIQGRPDLAPELEEARPRELILAQELVYCESSGVLKSAYRAPGENRVGMVGWKWTIYGPTHFSKGSSAVQPRTIYVVANDITVLSGSFSTQEDELYAAISRAAKLEGVPLVYLSSNSGARIGLDPELKKLFRIQEAQDSSKLFEYLYIDDETKKNYDAAAAASPGKKQRPLSEVCHTEEVVRDNGEVHHKLTAIIGSQWGLGVENLSGSGMIAGEMAQCYDAIPTISIASGRTVGIGAYLVRLGRRVVQVKGSPVILTGNNALNKLLGKEVYTSNSQLGGTNIMGPNGVTHYVVNHNYAAIQETMKWLDFIPDSTSKTAPPTLHRVRPVIDPIDRDVEIDTKPNTAYDVRTLIEGQNTENGWVSGLFDRGSFHEAQQDWAKTVVVGRATLGEIPMGVIGVETRALSKFNPADPADPSSISAMTQQAGQVWYPDSARKTADFLADLHREGLPVIILANWRGFSGGMRDMYDEVLKFGADIVQNLTHYEMPITVYIPPHGELRGGAWVVIDPTINKKCIEMYADETARGGVLEPSGIIEIKYREKEIHATMDRLDPECHRLSAQLRSSEGHLRSYLDRMLKERHEALTPQYKAVAVEFADLHDRPGRMLAVKSIDGVISWRNARRFLHYRMKKRLLQFHCDSMLKAAGVEEDDQKAAVHGWFAKYASGGQLIDGTSYPARESLEMPAGLPDAELYSAASDKQLVKFFEDIAGSELENAVKKTKLDIQVKKVLGMVNNDSKLAEALMEALKPEEKAASE